VAGAHGAALIARPELGTTSTRWDLVMRLGLLGIILILVVVFSVTAQGFLTLQNLDNNARQMAVVGILAVGETFVIITAGIDLSVGSLLGFGGIILALALAHNLPTFLAVIAVLATATCIGLVNGSLINAAALPPFIVTLGMLGILRGLTQILGNGQQVGYNAPSFTNFAAGTALGVPNLFWVFALVCILSGMFLHLTRRGRYMFAIGSSMESARRAGIKVGASILTVYAISGLLAGIAGILLTARQAQGDPNAGTGYELDAIAAAVLGGASLFGARGSIVGTFLGVTLVQIMTNGLNLLNFDPQVARMLEGALLILFVYLDHSRKPKTAAA
jgi:ribose transport system permease protein